MLEKIREGSQGFWAIAILGLVILSFVFAGVGGYISSTGDEAAAKVNGDEISVTTLERAYQNERARLESQFGEAFSALAADADYLREFRQSVLDRLIGDKLIEQTATKLGLRVSEAQIREAVANMPEFQIGGQFNNDRFQAVIRQAGFQSNTFKDYMRTEMTRQQVTRALLGSEFSLPGEAQSAHLLQQQTRDAKYLIIPSAPFAEQVTLTDEELNTYYQANLANYDTEEQVSVEYVELRTSDILPSIDANEEEAQTFYQQNMANYKNDEERRASHILIEFGEDKDAALAQAQDVLVKVNSGEDFAELAKTNSADTFSAENGGDLDWFGEGVMDPAFEEATFALANVGDVSDVVESAFGFHIIKLTDVKAEEITPFEQIKDEILQQVKMDKAAEEFFALQQRMAEVAFESPDSLEDVAAEVNAEIKESTLFTRNSAPQPVNGTAALSAAFSDEVLLEKVNSDLIEVADDHVLVLRVKQHEVERTRTLEEVKGEIETALRGEKAQQLAKEWADALLASINASEDVSAQLAEKSLEWAEEQGVNRFGTALNRDIAEELFKLAPESNKAVVEMNNGDVGLVELVKVNEAENAPEQQLVSLQQRLQSSRSQLMFSDLIESLRAKAEITMYN